MIDSGGDVLFYTYRNLEGEVEAEAYGVMKLDGCWEMVSLTLYHPIVNGFYIEDNIYIEKYGLIFNEGSLLDENENFVGEGRTHVFSGRSPTVFLEDFDIAFLPHSYNEAIKKYGHN